MSIGRDWITFYWMVMPTIPYVAHCGTHVVATHSMSLYAGFEIHMGIFRREDTKRILQYLYGALDAR